MAAAPKEGNTRCRVCGSEGAEGCALGRREIKTRPEIGRGEGVELILMMIARRSFS